MIKSSRSYILTVSADTNDNGYSKEEVEERLKSYTYVGQLEKGIEKNEITEKQFLHWQIYIENNNPIEFNTLRKKFDKKAIHIEKRSGTKKQAYDYCTKEDETYQGIRINNGEIELEDCKGKRNDLDNIADEILSGATEDEIFIKYPSSAHCMSYIRKLREIYIKKEYGEKIRKNIEVIYIYGDTGVGKTRSIYEEYNIKDVYRINDYKNPFDGYNYEKIIVFDEFNGQLPIELMLTLLDIYPVQLPCRYNNKYACYEKVYILSNKSLERQYNEDYQYTPIAQLKALERRIKKVLYFDKENHVLPRLSSYDETMINKNNNDELPF